MRGVKGFGVDSNTRVFKTREGGASPSTLVLLWRSSIVYSRCNKRLSMGDWCESDREKGISMVQA